MRTAFPPALIRVATAKNARELAERMPSFSVCVLILHIIPVQRRCLLTDKYPFFSMSGVTMDLSINVAYVVCRPSKVAN